VEEIALAQTLGNTVFNDRASLAAPQKLTRIVTDKKFIPPDLLGLIDWVNVHEIYRKMINTGQKDFRYGNSNCLMIHLLGALGITGWMVGWYVNTRYGDAGYDAHVTVEFLTVKWQLIDPKFNKIYELTETGGYISAVELYTL